MFCMCWLLSLYGRGYSSLLLKMTYSDGWIYFRSDIYFRYFSGGCLVHLISALLSRLLSGTLVGTRLKWLCSGSSSSTPLAMLLLITVCRQQVYSTLFCSRYLLLIIARCFKANGYYCFINCSFNRFIRISESYIEDVLLVIFIILPYILLLLSCSGYGHAFFCLFATLPQYSVKCGSKPRTLPSRQT